MWMVPYRPNPRLGNQKIYPRTRQTRQYFPWGGQVPPFGGGKSDFEVCIRGFFLNLKLFHLYLLFEEIIVISYYF